MCERARSCVMKWERCSTYRPIRRRSCRQRRVELWKLGVWTTTGCWYWPPGTWTPPTPRRHRCLWLFLLNTPTRQLLLGRVARRILKPSTLLESFLLTCVRDAEQHPDTSNQRLELVSGQTGKLYSHISPDPPFTFGGQKLRNLASIFDPVALTAQWLILVIEQHIESVKHVLEASIFDLSISDKL